MVGGVGAGGPVVPPVVIVPLPVTFVNVNEVPLKLPLPVRVGKLPVAPAKLPVPPVIVADPVPVGLLDNSVNGNDSVPVRFPPESTAVKGALIVALVRPASGIVALNVPFPIPLSAIVPLAVIPEAPRLPVALTVNVVVVVAASDAATARKIRDKVVHVRFMGCKSSVYKALLLYNARIPAVLAQVSTIV
jgi:hypothetical protein